MIISSIGDSKVMGSIKRWFFSGIQSKVLHGICISTVIGSFLIIVVLAKDPTLTYTVVILFLLVLLSLCLSCGSMYLQRRKFILKNNVNTVDDLFTNIASLIPSVDEVVLLEEKALRYLNGIKGALSSRFNCQIHFMACGSLSERFGVPLVNDWIGDIGRISVKHALLSDQDFLIEPFGITASYSAQSDTLEIVQSESFIEEGFAMLRVSKCMARRFKLMEGFSSTDTIKQSVKRCISKAPTTNFPGIVKRDLISCYDKLLLYPKRQVEIHGPAINVFVRAINYESIFLADFTFAIRCFQWPAESDWPFRNKMWPDHRVVKTIKDIGFHFVPKNQENDKSKLTWRYSFSLAERELSKQLNEVARKCFLCLKTISVDHLKPICKRLSSYHLKTILFRTLEVTSTKMWSEENILNCLNYLLKELQEAFHQQRCMHFWISRINLFQNFNPSRLSKLEVKVKEIRKNPSRFLFTYSLKRRQSFPPFKKNEGVFCCCLALYRDDWIMNLEIEDSRRRNSMSEEAAAEEGNHVQVTIVEAPLNIDSYPVRSYGSFSQKENL